MSVSNASLSSSYQRLAPFYDLFVKRVFDSQRARVIASLELAGGQRVLVSGAGTGLDLPHLPEGVVAVAVDLSPAMLAAARPRLRRGLLVVGDAQKLPFRTAAFDAGLLHLVLAIVPDGRLAFAEAVRVCRPGARLSVFDKFLKGAPSLARRAADALLRPFVTGFLTRFEELLPANARVVSDRGGLFRRILVEKVRSPERAEPP